MVGSRTKKKLNEMGVFTIGELARTPESKLERRFGVIGSLLWTYANGLDKTPVAHIHDKVPIKSIGNSKTVVKDIESLDQLQEVFRVLSETVAVRLRKEGLKAKSISIWLRDTDLKGRQGCGKFKQPTDLSKDILERAMELTWKMGLDEISLRSVGIHVSGLCPDIGCDQLDLFHTADYRQKERLTEEVMYEIRKLYGYQACRMASSRVDAVLTDFDPLSLLHEVHPVGVLKGPVKRT
jgi:DNA polymerase-4